MGFHDEKINYTNFMKDKPLEKDPEKIKYMERAAAAELADLGIFYGLNFVCYADGCVRVSVNGRYYNMFDSKTGRFFSGYVGDRWKGGNG